jgi:sirohydrochlorin cobaltochelatase
MPRRKNTALVIVGHGSTLNPDSSQPTHEHADSIRRMGIFDEVVCAFWKEEPGMREVLRAVDSPEVYVVPNFISEGYFTQEVIPRELGLTGKTTDFPRHRVHYCAPVGLHPSMTKLLLKRAAEVAPGVPREDCSLIIVGHGTGLNENSTKAIKDQVALIRGMDCGFREVLDAYMEEPPLVADWAALTTAPNVIVVPFFIADGLHSYQDIPVLLGIEKEPTAAASQVDVFRRNPYHLQGRQLYFSSSIGTEPLLAEVILDQVAAFDGEQTPGPLREPQGGKITGALEQWLASGEGLMGEVLVRRSTEGFVLRHCEDANAAVLTRHAEPEAAREIAKYDATGEFRPLKTAPSLKRGWELVLTDTCALQLALEFFYPGAVGNFLRYSADEICVPALRETLNRQTGIYRVTALIRDDEAASLTAAICGQKCLRRVLWSLDDRGNHWSDLPAERQTAVSSGNEWPLLCTDPCQLLVGGARTIVKKRMKAEAETAGQR